MNKEKLILEKAVELFSKKGYAAASIQDIANACGIAKGSLYSYFPSKDMLLLAALNYYFEQVMDKVKAVPQQEGTEREIFIRQLTVFLESILAHKDFMDLSMYSQSSTIHHSIQEMAAEKQEEIYAFYSDGIAAVYGDRAVPFIYDLSVMLEGILRSYMHVFSFSDYPEGPASFIAFLMRRMDDIAEGLTVKKEAPILTEIHVQSLRRKWEKSRAGKKEKLQAEIEAIRKALQGTADKEYFIVSLDVLEEELAAKHPRLPVIDGMLSNFTMLKQVSRHVKEIRTLLKEK